MKKLEIHGNNKTRSKIKSLNTLDHMQTWKH